jgi:hypothetical protein
MYFNVCTLWNPQNPSGSIEPISSIYVINYVLLRGEDQTGTDPSPEILKKKIKKNWPSHNIELLGMTEWLCTVCTSESL